MSRRAFSLLEVLIAIAVTAAIAGVVFANMSGWTARSRFEAASRQVESAAALVRADAMREGRALSLVAVEGEHAWKLEVEPFGTDEAADETGPNGQDRRRSRAVMDLPGGVHLASTRPRPLDSEPAPVRVPQPAGAASAATGSARVDVCVLLPDGSAWGEVKFVVGPGERLAEVRVTAWTGTARVVEVPWPAPTDEPAGEEKPPAP